MIAPFLIIICAFALVIMPIARRIFTAPTDGDDYNPSRHKGRKTKMRTNIVTKRSKKKNYY